MPATPSLSRFGGCVLLLACAAAAVMIAGFMADAGMTGSCFEGQCAYNAMFFVAPALTLLLFFVARAVWKTVRKRTEKPDRPE